MTYLPVFLGMTVASTKYPSRKLVLKFERYTNLGVIAQPRYGKGGVAKPLVVQVSKHRRVCVFDFRGEWSRHATNPNYDSPHPDFIGEYAIYRGFTFKLADFVLTQDWVSMGFGNGSEQLKNLFCETLHLHKGLPKKFLEIIMDLPTKENQVDVFTAKYGPVLRGAFNWMYVQEYKNQAPYRLKWFWQGPQDQRPVFDFGKEWLEHQNIFIDFTTDHDGDVETTHRHQTFFGKIMERLRPLFPKLQGVIVIEEADVLLPNPRGGPRPSSNVEMIWFSAKAPKDGMSAILIMQNREQTDDRIFRGGQWSWLLGLYENYPKPFRGLPQLNGAAREFVHVDPFRRWTKFTPAVPCCEYESNVRPLQEVYG